MERSGKIRPTQLTKISADKMKYELNTKLDFGKYRGLTVQQIYQGTLNIDKGVIKEYLDFILNSDNFKKWAFFDGSTLIERFEISQNKIELIGEIHDCELPEGPQNRIVFGNIEKQIANYINQHFKANFLGVLPDIGEFNKKYNLVTSTGGSPDYLKWCETNIEKFELSRKCKLALDKISYARLSGFNILYIGKEIYEYAPMFDIK
jgi:hypothetical protein